MQRLIGLCVERWVGFYLYSTFKCLFIIGRGTVSMNIVALTLQMGQKIKMTQRLQLHFCNIFSREMWYARRKCRSLVRMIGFISTLIKISLNHI
jgi:hypothetical protein